MMAQQLFGVGVKELNKMQASNLIDDLLEKVGKRATAAAPAGRTGKEPARDRRRRAPSGICDAAAAGSKGNPWPLKGNGIALTAVDFLPARNFESPPHERIGRLGIAAMKLDRAVSKMVMMKVDARAFGSRGVHHLRRMYHGLRIGQIAT